MKHKQIILLLLARMLERAGYFGLRSILVLYFVYTLDFEEHQATDVYSYFMLGIVLSYVPGALLGDLLLGNKRATVIGAGLMAAGAFLFCIPMPMFIYIGLVLLCLGFGLFDSNFLSRYVKTYLDRKSQLDSGLALLYAVVNFGAIVGTYLIMSWIDSFDYYVGFMTGGLFFTGATIISAFVRSDDVPDAPQYIKHNIAFQLITGIILLTASFWIVFEFANESLGSIQQQLLEADGLRVSLLVQGSVGLFTLPICVLAAVVWAFFHYNSWIKLTFGFLSGALAYLVLSTIPGNLSSTSLGLYGFSMLLLALAEINIQPVVYAFIARHANPKFLAIVFSLLMMPTKILAYIYPIYQLHSEGNEHNEFLASAAILAVISVGLGVFFIVKRKSAEWA